jgi:hypothetical protein
LQSSDERPGPTGRPSLLPSEPQAQTEQQRLLAGLDATSAAGGRRRISAWGLGSAIAVVAAVAGGALWVNGVGDVDSAGATAQLPAPAPATATSPASPGAPAAAEAQVSSAAILEDAPALPDKSAPAMANKAALAAAAASTTANKADADPLAALRETKAAPAHGAPAVAHAAARAAPHVVGERAEPRALATHKPIEKKPTPSSSTRLAQQRHAAKPAAVATARKGSAPLPPAPEADSDVALLAALVAHSKVSQPAGPTPAALKLKECKTRGSVAEADECRTRLCTGAAKNDAACKPPAGANKVVNAS